MKDLIITLLKAKPSPLSIILHTQLQALYTALEQGLIHLPEDIYKQDIKNLCHEIKIVLEKHKDTSVIEHTDSIEIPSSSYASAQDSIQKFLELIPELKVFTQKLPQAIFDSIEKTWNNLVAFTLHMNKNELLSLQQQITHLSQTYNIALDSKMTFITAPLEGFLIPQPMSLQSVTSLKKQKIFPKEINTILDNNLYPDIEEIYFFAQTVTLAIEMLERDDLMQHALYEVATIGIHDFYYNPTHKKLYKQIIIDLFSQICLQKENNISQFKARLRLDTALQSLLHFPLADNNSYWNELRQLSRNHLFDNAQKLRQQGFKIQLQTLSGQLKNIQNKTQNNISCSKKECGCQPYTPPGTVLLCLQVWANIEEQIFPGRVLFCSH